MVKPALLVGKLNIFSEQVEFFIYDFMFQFFDIATKSWMSIFSVKEIRFIWGNVIKFEKYFFQVLFSQCKTEWSHFHMSLPFKI